jgi:hypothetical protein
MSEFSLRVHGFAGFLFAPTTHRQRSMRSFWCTDIKRQRGDVMIVNSIFSDRAQLLGLIIGVRKLAKQRARRRSFSLVVLGAITICTWQGPQTAAAVRIDDRQSVPHFAFSGNGASADENIAPRKQTAIPPTFNSRSLSGSGRCATLRKRYAQSEACFSHYRLKNRGLKPCAFQHCRQLKDPSWECGSVVVP